jgi:flagellar basal body P-ring formation protein FlgA
MPLAILRRSIFSLIVAALASIQAHVLAAEELLLPVPNVTIYPGDSIRENWLVDRDFSTSPMAPKGGMINTHAALVGKIARRTLLPGVPIPATAVGEPRLVTNGEKVRVVFTEGGLTITTYGSALQAGGAGDVVSVRNLDSGLTISGVVQPDGSIRVSGG